MNILLNPEGSKPEDLAAVYQRAISRAVELYVATAYLTNWSSNTPLSKQCKRVVFLVGIDFGLTRKLALRDVMKWLPKNATTVFGAVVGPASGGFHPKIVLWRESTGTRWCLIGSSNLSRAAFSTNYEANVAVRVSSAQYFRVSRWLDSIAERSAAVTPDWVDNHYQESKKKVAPGQKKKGLKTTAAIELILPTGKHYALAVRERRKQQQAFAEIAPPLRQLIRHSSKGTLSNPSFWQQFWSLWSDHESRFQGSGLQISGKSANWRQACRAIVAVLDLPDSATGAERDHVVSREIDALAKAGNPARGAWLTEMLCHLFPERYPIVNGPVVKWLRRNKWRPRPGSTEGQRYIQFAQQLRAALSENTIGAKNLAEMDLAIWRWVHVRGL